MIDDGSRGARFLAEKSMDLVIQVLLEGIKKNKRIEELLEETYKAKFELSKIFEDYEKPQIISKKQEETTQEETQ
jgi:hypothetical protein